MYAEFMSSTETMTLTPDITWHDDLNDVVPLTTAGLSGGVVWIADDDDGEDRLSTHQALVGCILAREPDEIVLGHDAAGVPIVLSPRGTGLSISRSARPGIALVAVASKRIGVDVEEADGSADVPWNVLSQGERAPLIGLSEDKRTIAFAVLWSVKEAYLKALGVGLLREPSSFTVQIGEGGRVTITDPQQPGLKLLVRAQARRKNGKLYAMSAVLID